MLRKVRREEKRNKGSEGRNREEDSSPNAKLSPLPQLQIAFLLLSFFTFLLPLKASSFNSSSVFLESPVVLEHIVGRKERLLGLIGDRGGCLCLSLDVGLKQLKTHTHTHTHTHKEEKEKNMLVIHR